MTDSKITNFSVLNSIFRMDNILKETTNDYCEKDFIPSPESLTYKDGYNVTCAVLCVDIRDSSTLPDIHTLPVLAKIYRAYISEVIALIKSCGLHRHIHIVGDAVIGVFNVPFPSKSLNDIFELAGKLSSLIGILNDKLAKRNYTPIRVGIGLSYGKVLMIKAGRSGTGYNDIIWMGDAVNRASKLANYGNKEPEKGDMELMVSTRFYEKLSPEYKRLLSFSQCRSAYTGKIHDIELKKFHEKMNTPQAKPRTVLGGAPYNFSSVPFSLLAYTPPPEIIKDRNQRLAELLWGKD